MRSAEPPTCIVGCGVSRPAGYAGNDSITSRTQCTERRQRLAATAITTTAGGRDVTCYGNWELPIDSGRDSNAKTFDVGRVNGAWHKLKQTETFDIGSIEGDVDLDVVDVRFSFSASVQSKASRCPTLSVTH